MTPLQLVDLLNEVFQCFDGLVEKYDLEKIKTIGDCYMVASGVPCPRPDHVVALVNLALDMLAVIAERRFGGRQLAFRIGIHSVPWSPASSVARNSSMICGARRSTWRAAWSSWPQPLCSDHAQHLRLDQGSFDCEALGLMDVKERAPRRCGTSSAEGLRLPTRRSNGRLLRSRSDAIGPQLTCRSR